jgi:hypothetical protein
VSQKNVLPACLFLLVTAWAASLVADEKRIDFSHDVVPILKSRCAECHTDGQYKGSLSLDSRADLLKSEAVVPGKSGESELFRRITSTDPDERMPSKGDPLSAKEIAVIKNWIDQGLVWEPGFRFQAAVYVAPLKPRRVELPPARDDLRHPIDRLVSAYWEQHKVTPPALLDDAAFARRVYLDVVGLLPATEELQRFVGDPASDKRTRLVQALLADRRGYADHWLAFWNDLLRNEYRGTGYIDGGRKQISQWLYQSLLDNKAYDQFVRELISPTAESEGFILGIKWRGRVNASQVPPIQFSQNVSQVFFGINMKCASCHDSFIDHWKLDDAYSLAAVVADEPLEIHRCDKATGKMAAAGFLWPELGKFDAQAPKAQRLGQLAALVTHPENGRFSRTLVNRLWHRLMGRGIVHPVDVMANQPWNSDLLDYLATYLADHQYDMCQLLEHILTSRAYQSETIPVTDEIETEAFVFRGPQLKRMSAEQFLDAIWQITGTAPKKANAPMKLPEFSGVVPPERQYIRATLMHSDPLMRSLGRPNREQVVTTRGDVLTTLQALDLSNGPEMTELIARGAASLLKSHEKSTATQIVDRLFLRALSRPPNADEAAAAQSLVGDPVTQEGLEDLLWAVCMLPEFQLIR